MVASTPQRIDMDKVYEIHESAVEETRQPYRVVWSNKGQVWVEADDHYPIGYDEDEDWPWVFGLSDGGWIRSEKPGQLYIYAVREDGRIKLDYRHEEYQEFVRWDIDLQAWINGRWDDGGRVWINGRWVDEYLRVWISGRWSLRANVWKANVGWIGGDSATTWVDMN
jgi:hypothetical protein